MLSQLGVLVKSRSLTIVNRLQIIKITVKLERIQVEKRQLTPSSYQIYQ